VFSYPGLGLLTYEAVSEQDYVLMQTLFLVFTLSVIVSNLVADIVIAAIDPRIRT
jgi:peptide/nickel transport system permease protein